MFRSRASLGRKRGHRAPAIRPGGTLGLAEAAGSDARLFQDSSGKIAMRVTAVRMTPGLCPGARALGWLGLPWVCCTMTALPAPAEPRASRVPSSDEEVVEEPQSRRTRMTLGHKGLKVNLFPGLSPAALKVACGPRQPPGGAPVSAYLLSAPLQPVLFSITPLFSEGPERGPVCSCPRPSGTWVSLGRAWQEGGCWQASGPGGQGSLRLGCDHRGGQARCGCAVYQGPGAPVTPHPCSLSLPGFSRRPSCAPGTARLKRRTRQRARAARRSLLCSAPSPARSQGWGSPSYCPPSQRSPQGR